jgi:ketosteroid isomerase-like protein
VQRPDLAYLVQIERLSAKVGGRDEPSSGSLRITMIFRRESDGWRIAHRHASPGGIRHRGPVRRSAL